MCYPILHRKYSLRKYTRVILVPTCVVRKSTDFSGMCLSGKSFFTNMKSFVYGGLHFCRRTSEVSPQSGTFAGWDIRRCRARFLWSFGQSRNIFLGALFSTSGSAGFVGRILLSLLSQGDVRDLRGLLQLPSERSEQDAAEKA